MVARVYSSRSDGHCSHPDPDCIRSRWWIRTERWSLQPWMSTETRTTRWAPETDPKWRPSEDPLDSHRDKATGTRWVLCTIWLCCSLELKLLVHLARGELPPRLSLVSPKVYFSVLSPMEFWFLAVVASGLLSWGHLFSSDIIDLIAQILFKLNWAGRLHH